MNNSLFTYIEKKRKRLIQYVRRQRNKKKKMKEKNLYLSFGENCLTDGILERYGIKSFSTPYSSNRTNVEYELQLERDRFKDFLNTDYMQYEYWGEKKVLRLKKYNVLQNQYDEPCMHGFEFTHQDILESSSNYQKQKRRYERMLNLHDHNLYMLYHHRYCPETDFDLMIDQLAQLREIYLERCPKAELILFTQSIVKDASERKVERAFINGIHVYIFYTLNVWEGTNDDILWARCDDDLIQVMIEDIKKM